MNKNTFSSQLNAATNAESPLVEWISTNKKLILYGIIALFALVIIALRFVSSQTLNAENDFFHAQSDFNRLQTTTMQANTTGAIDSLNRIDPILKKHPELQAKYDGQIAQYLIIDQAVNEAKPLAERSFNRLKNSPTEFYEQFAKTTLLISNGQYEQAAQQAQQLKSQLDQAKASEFGDTLYVFNLVRLGILYQQLNQPAEEKQTWEALQKYRGHTETVLVAHQLFRDGNNSLMNYVEERNKALNP
ncbi:MAG: hypothetical protein H0W88_04280 [Parachlamydiaceae bacterium]|nr:hypothetical protein [Parachlamydiaceae bacterium]